MFTLDTCRSCQAPVIWAVTSGGKTMPVDADPTSDGNVILNERPGGGATAVVMPVAETGEQAASLFEVGVVKRHKSHFATCPHAADWRQAGGR